MKTRSTFVSNSSSSSFIIGLKNIPKTKEKMKKLLFGDEDSLRYCDETYSTLEIAEKVLNDLKNTTPIEESKIEEVIKSGWFDGKPEFNIKEYYKLIDEFKNKYKISYYSTLTEKQKSNKSLVEDYNKINDFYIKMMDNYEILKDKAAKECWRKNSAKFKGLKCYKLIYSDNEGEGHLEHGGIFDSIPCVRVSHH